MADVNERFYEFDVHDLEILEFIERRSRNVVQNRQNDLEDLDVDFRSRYRLNKSTVETLTECLGPKLESSGTRNQALTPTEKILIALRFFATGNQQLSIGDLIRCSQSSVSRAVTDVASLAELRPQYIYLPENEDQRREVSTSFYRLCGFPSVIGVLDCTHIELQSPGGDIGELFRCRKGFFSLNVQTLSDADLFIRNIVVRWPGSTHDCTVFDNSYLRAHLETEVPFRYHVLGDNGYPLRPYLMTPFLHPNTESQKRYNTAHILGRNVVERQYGVWKRRFPCVSLPLRCSLSTAQTIIVATAVLHNISLTLGNEFCEPEITYHDDGMNCIDHERAGTSKRNAIVNTYF